MATSTKNKVGRPSSYTQELADEIIELIRNGYSEHEICRKRGMPSLKTLWNWKDQHPEFLRQSARARADSAMIFDDLRMKEVTKLKRLAENRLDLGLELPRTYIEAKKVIIQEFARSAALRDDSKFGDRKQVALTGADGGAVKVETKQEYDLSKLSVSQLEALEAILHDSDTSKPSGDTTMESS